MEKYNELIKKHTELEKQEKKELESYGRLSFFYKTKRPVYMVNTMFAVTILPIVLLLFTMAILTSFYKEIFIYIRELIILVIGICCFIISPIVVKRERDKVKEYYDLLKDKTKDEIIIDDYNVYFKRLLCSKKSEIHKKVCTQITKKVEDQKLREKVIKELEKDYTISPIQKEKLPVDNKLLDKNKELYLQLKEKTKILAAINYFDFMFKQDFIKTFALTAMASMCAMMYWNLPFAIANDPEKNPISMPVLILNMFIPIIITILIPIIYNWFNRKYHQKAFEEINAELGNLIKLNQYVETIKEEYNNQIEKIQDEIVDNIIEYEFPNSKK